MSNFPEPLLALHEIVELAKRHCIAEHADYGYNREALETWGATWVSEAMPSIKNERHRLSYFALWAQHYDILLPCARTAFVRYRIDLRGVNKVELAMAAMIRDAIAIYALTQVWEAYLSTNKPK